MRRLVAVLVQPIAWTVTAITSSEMASRRRAALSGGSRRVDIGSRGRLSPCSKAVPPGEWREMGPSPGLVHDACQRPRGGTRPLALLAKARQTSRSRAAADQRLKGISLTQWKPLLTSRNFDGSSLGSLTGVASFGRA